MSRNSEKAQSMLYRFREQQAIEMGLSNRVRGERRPRIASSVTNLRECEKWRSDIMRDISRKVSKIQDPSLGDYEIRDLNDEINQLLREKRHWENQIIALGGANYKRAQISMVDEAGKEVPGTRGYKYFGRARELPGVKELFAKGAQAHTEEAARNASFQMFRNQGPEYYGDNDEMDEELMKEEEEMVRQEWEKAVRATASVLSIDNPSVPFPEPSRAAPATDIRTASSSSKRKSPEPTDATDSIKDTTPDTESNNISAQVEEDDEESGGKSSADENGNGEGTSKNKKSKSENVVPPPPPPGAPPVRASGKDEQQQQRPLMRIVMDPATIRAQAEQAALAARFMNVFDAESLKPPVLPDMETMGKILLDVRKKAIMEEYGV